jgi:hypothetical protein
MIYMFTIILDLSKQLFRHGYLKMSASLDFGAKLDLQIKKNYKKNKI